MESNTAVGSVRWFHDSRVVIAALAIIGIIIHLVLRFNFSHVLPYADVPLQLVIVLGGIPLIWTLVLGLLKGQFGADLLAAVSIITAVILGEYLAGALVVLMLSGGEAIERYAIDQASHVLNALMRRMPTMAHKRVGTEVIEIPVADLVVGDTAVIFPHEVAPADGVVLEGHGSMDEAFLTGEPFRISKAPGAEVISGALNGDRLIVIRVSRAAIDSRYAKIVKVMQAAELNRPNIRRLGDLLGAYYTPVALIIAGASWLFSGEPVRFLSVLVVATPCPLLIGIPVAVIGSISLAARRGIIIKNPSALELIDRCRTLIIDKTGTLTYGRPVLTEVLCFHDFTREAVLQRIASLERYSKHPLAGAVLKAAQVAALVLAEPSEVREVPGAGLTGTVGTDSITVTGRHKLSDSLEANLLPPPEAGLECLVLVNNRLAGLLKFRDEPRADSRSFVEHLAPLHGFDRVMIVSGDRESEVRYLADKVGIKEIYSSKSPEEKVQIVVEETKKNKTVFIGDGINDAPALVAATVGISFGQQSDITSEAADAVVMDTSLKKVDEYFHIGRRMRRIALQSAVGGMIASVLGMLVAADGLISPVSGALFQEGIDLIAVLSALRASMPPRELSDFGADS